MNRLCRIALFVVVVGGSKVASAGDYRFWCDWRSDCATRPFTGCPDDYCRKPMPRAVCLPCGLPDDYCRKPLPRCWQLPCGEPDDYCRKPWPSLCRPLRPEHYNCGQQVH